MVLTRLGNKRRLAPLLQPLFPKHKLRIELFFGAGGSYFYLPTPQYSILNDFDNDVTNLYLVILKQRDALYHAIQILPISDSLLKYWASNFETDPIKKAVRFLLLANFTYLGKGNTLRLSVDNSKKVLLEAIEPTFLKLQDSKITSVDFREVIGKISFSEKIISKENSFVYLDPIYLDTCHYYKVPKWSEKDTEDCFKIMANCGIKCALSEFDHEMILDFSSDYNMFTQTLKNRTNIKTKSTEILVTNYQNPQGRLF